MSAVSKFKTRALWQRAVTVSRGSRQAGGDDHHQPVIGSGGAGTTTSTGTAGGAAGAGGTAGTGSATSSNTTTGTMFRSQTSFHKLAANLLESKKVLEKEKELKSKADELVDLKAKYDQEQADRQRLQKQLDDLCSSQTDSARKLLRAQDVSEKLRTDNRKKAEQIEKLDKTISHMEDRIRNLEIRASEVEKAELTLESTRRTLENSQAECRAKEKDLEREREKYDDACKDLTKSQHRIGELERKLEDLKLQVRHELMKNENIEKGLETIPRLKDDIEERDKKIEALQKDVEEKSVLLNASRRAARDYKDQLREIERRDVEAACLREELEVSRNEVDTLKRLMGGKDMLVLQKCQALDTAKSAVSSLRASSSSDHERSSLRQIQTVLDQLRQIYADSVANSPAFRNQKPLPHNRFAQSRPRSAMAHNHDSNRGIDVNNHPYSADNNNNSNNSGNNNNNHSNLNNGANTNNHHGSNIDLTLEIDPSRSSSTYMFLERFLDETEGLNQKRARTAPGNNNNNNNNNTSNGQSSSSTIQRRASFHYLDHQNHDHVNNGSNNNYNHNNYNNSNNNNNPSGLHSRRRATSSQNVSTSKPFSSAASPRSKTRTSTTTLTAPNLYTSETTTATTSNQKLKHQPSLEYCLGLSTDDEQTIENTTYCLSGRPKRSSNVSSTNAHPPSSSSSSSRPRTTASTTAAFGVSIGKRGQHQHQHHHHSAIGSDSESGSHDPIGGDGGKLSQHQLTALSRLSGSEKDRMLVEVIHVGDRVTITVTQRPPRYGRKKPKPVTHTGIVKYKGLLDSDNYDARIYVGMKLDSPLGDSDGMHKGKRYMFTPKDHGKFFKIRDLDSVLDVSSSQYIPISRLLLRQLEPDYSQATSCPITNGYTASSVSHSLESGTGGHTNSQAVVY